MKRVVLVDSRPSAVRELEAFLSATDDFHVVRTLGDLSGIKAVIAETRADVLVLDLDAAPPAPNMFAGLKQLQPELKIVGIGASAELTAIRSAFAFGADGYHVRTVTAAELVAGMRRILLATELTPIGGFRSAKTAALRTPLRVTVPAESPTDDTADSCA